MSDEKNYTMNRANAAVLSRDFVLAARLYKSILKKAPDNIEALTQLASCYVRAGDDKKALQVCLEILKKEPNNFSVMNNLGGIYRRLGMYIESIAILERALAMGKNANTIYYNMGHTYKMMGEYADAEECFLTVIEENPKDVLAYNHLGSIQALRGENNKAIQTYARGLQIDPNHPILHFNIALSYEAIGKLTDARLSYENALRSRPGWIEAMGKYADLLSRLKLYDEAREVLMQALQIEEDNVDIQNTLGKLNLKLNDLEEAEKYFNSVLKKIAKNFVALWGLSAVYERQGKNKDAADILERLEKIDSENLDIQLLYAKVLMHLNRLREAAEKIKNVRDSAPKNLEALNLLGQLFILKNETRRLQDCFRKISSIDPDYIQHYLDCGETHYEMKNYDEAKSCVKKYISRDEKDSYAFKLLGKIYEAMKQYLKALHAYQKGLKLNPNDSELINGVARLIKYEGIEEEKEKPIDESVAESLAAEENFDLLEEEKSILDKFNELEEEPLTFEIQEEEIPFDEMPQDENVPPLEEVTEDGTPLDFSNIDDDDMENFDPFMNRRKQSPIEEEQDEVEVESDIDPLDFSDDDFIDLLPEKDESELQKEQLKPEPFKPFEQPSYDTTSEPEKKETKPEFAKPKVNEPETNVPATTEPEVEQKTEDDLFGDLTQSMAQDLDTDELDTQEMQPEKKTEDNLFDDLTQSMPQDLDTDELNTDELDTEEKQPVPESKVDEKENFDNLFDSLTDVSEEAPDEIIDEKDDDETVNVIEEQKEEMEKPLPNIYINVKQPLTEKEPEKEEENIIALDEEVENDDVSVKGKTEIDGATIDEDVFSDIEDIDSLFEDDEPGDINDEWLKQDVKNFSDDLEKYFAMLKQKLKEAGVSNFFPEMTETIDMLYFASTKLKKEVREQLLNSGFCRRLGYMVERLIGIPGLLAAATAINETGYADTIIDEYGQAFTNYEKIKDEFLNLFSQSEIIAELKTRLIAVNGRWVELLSVK